MQRELKIVLNVEQLCHLSAFLILLFFFFFKFLIFFFFCDILPMKHNDICNWKEEKDRETALEQ